MNTLMILAAGVIVAIVIAHAVDIRRQRKAPKRAPTLTEEYLRNRALNAKRRPKP